ncbi:hypothetical protein GmHk_05G012749 [Glycine max]|nr:hypothetical protein GmHk_05G012749 [Glycine max]
MKKMNSTVFKVWKTRKLWKAFGKRKKKKFKETQKSIGKRISPKSLNLLKSSLTRIKVSSHLKTASTQEGFKVISHLEVAYSKGHHHLTKMHNKTLSTKHDSQGAITISRYTP